MKGHPVHFHTEAAMKKASGIEIGKIMEPLTAKIFKPLSSGAGPIENETWKMVKKEMLTTVHARFQFKNENYKVSAMQPYFDHCGKYYTVSLYLLYS